MRYSLAASFLLFQWVEPIWGVEKQRESALLRRNAQSRLESAVKCTYAEGEILLDGGNDGQNSKTKHICIASSECDPEGKKGMVYTIPPEVLESLAGEDLVTQNTEFIIHGAHISGNTNLDDRIVMRHDWSVEVLPAQSKEADRRRQINQKTVFGKQTAIVARVTATDSSVSYSSEELQERYYGTDAGSVALQYNLCSAGQYSVVPDADTNGVVELAWNFKSSGVDVEDSIENSLRVAFESAYGSHDDYGHVIYCLPSGFNGFRGYTYPDTNEIWLYNDWCGFLSMPFNQIGSNLGLSLSNGADGTEFEDRSCMMGLSYSSSFAPRMCFNGHKFWVLGWFSSYRTVVDPTVHGATSVDVAAFVDGQKLSSSSNSFVVAINVGNLYLVFNRAKDYNDGTQGRANQVTVTQGLDAMSPSRSLGGIDLASSSFSASTFLSTGNELVFIEFCEERLVTLAGGDVDVMRISIRTGSQNRTCDISSPPPSSSPSKYPSVYPSTPPSVYPSASPSTTTAFPTPSAFLCDDTDGYFFVNETNTTEPCIWLQTRPQLVPSLCREGTEARKVCSETCGACTDECKDTSNLFPINEILRDCDWLRIRPGQQVLFCVVSEEAYNACPETCNACDGRDYPSTTPSAMPSNRPSFQGETVAPSASPSTTASPSVLPDGVCDDDPDGTFPVPFLQTNEPCIWLAARPQFQPELCIEGLPAYDLCEETCGKCVDGCEDTSDTFAIEEVQRDCEWLSLRPGEQISLCITGSEAYSVCPETCNACEHSPTSPPAPSSSPFCDDNPDGTFPVPVLGTNEPCIWLAARPQFQAELCQGPAFDLCVKTCGKCSDGCEDTGSTFLFENVERSCEWLKLRPAVQDEVCFPGSDAYDNICSETCNACDGAKNPTVSLQPSPSLTVSPRPSGSPSAMSSSDNVCDDDPVGTFPFLGTNEPCIWLADRPQFQPELCIEGLPAYDLCEETCGKCADDCEDTDGTFVVNNIQRDCEWLILRSGQQPSLCFEGSEVAVICPETCNFCDGASNPTVSPVSPYPSSVPSATPSTSPPYSPSAVEQSQAPSTVPTPRPTGATPHPITFGCDDDQERSFYVESIDQVQSCLWLSARPIFQVILCDPNDPTEAFDICEETCGKCADDCEDTDGTFVVNGITRDCKWLVLRSGQQPSLCFEGSEVAVICPETCNFCDGASNPTVSPVSPYPSSVPRATPSTSPSAILCDDTDGDFFSPTTGKREPCIWLEARLELVPELCTTGSDASLVCPETCGVCSDDCEDTDGEFVVGDATRDCDWLKIRPGFIETLCIEGSDAYTACPETCDACDGTPALPKAGPSPCDDTAGYFFVDATGKSEPCIWLQDRPEFVASLCASDGEAYSVCPETCGGCQDNCEDTDGYFLIGGVTRDCEWLRVRPGLQEKLCLEGTEPFSVCPETCNACD